MSNQIINNNPIGVDSLKGGYFANGNLIPNGLFPVVPNFKTYNKPNVQTSEKIILTLQQVKDSLQKTLNNQNQIVDDITVERYLYETINLLIDYRDIRNYVFFGSANTEIAYNINFLVNNYPYEFLINNSDLLKFNVLQFNSNQTSIIFDKSFIVEGIEQFNYFDGNTNFDWTKYQIVDVNNNVYPIKKVYTPYVSSTIYLNKTLSNYKISIETPNTIGFPAKVKIIPDSTVFKDKDTISIRNSSRIIDGEYFLSSTGIENEFYLNKQNDESPLMIPGGPLSSIIDNFTDGTPAIIRSYPPSNITDFEIKIIVDGILLKQNFNKYSENSGITKYGFKIQPINSITTTFEFNLTDIQKMLLSPVKINPNPWPRETYTNNIIVDLKNNEFNAWINNDNLLYIPENNQNDDIFYATTATLNTEYSLIRAISLDQSYTNQLIRKCVPDNMIDDFNDTENGYFQRFILIAGWLFDQIKVYTQFIKYMHHVNYSQYNQLSPEYYKFYASHYGLDLFTDDDIDFSSLIVKTETGLSYQNNSNLNSDNKFYQKTLKELQYEKQKRLLLGLLYLYQTKGTIISLQTLISLLGSPQNLFVLKELSYQINTNDYGNNPDNMIITGSLLEDNNKIYCPIEKFEIDTDHTYNKSGLPILYRKKLSNDNILNLRSININTNPNAAIDFNLIDYFSKKKYSYLNIINDSNISTSSTLPLNLPRNYFGIVLEYMLPEDGIFKEEKSYIKLIKLNDEQSNILDLFIEFNEFDLIIRSNNKYNHKWLVVNIPNIFKNDGLNHLLKIQINSNNVEIYEDYQILGIKSSDKIGFSNWKIFPIVNNEPILPTFSSINSDLISVLRLNESLYNQLTIENYPKELFFYLNNLSSNEITESANYNNFNLRIGEKSFNINKFYLKTFSIIENYSKDSFSETTNIDNSNGYTARTFTYDFSNIIGQSCKLNYFPLFIGLIDNRIYPDAILNFTNSVEKIIQDFFDKKELFSLNVYQKNLKKSYKYEKFSGLINKLYNIYSPNVLTYQSLSSFLKLVEVKFRTLIESFIPIAVNIANFGRSINNSFFNQSKINYPNVEKYCEISNNTQNFIQIDFANVKYDNYNLQDIGFGNPFSFIFNVNSTTITEHCMINSSLAETVFDILTLLNNDYKVELTGENILIIYWNNNNDNVSITISSNTYQFLYNQSFIKGDNSVEENCGNVKYSPLVIIDNNPYIYKKSEGFETPYIYKKSEGEQTEQIYIKEKNEI